MGKKTSSISSVERLFNLSMFLISEKLPLTLRQIITCVDGYSDNKDFESNRRMFFRDKKDLLHLGLEIKVLETPDPMTGHDVDGYIIDTEDFYLPSVNFTAAEKEALAALSGRFASAPGEHSFPGPGLDWALMKLTGGAGPSSGDGAVLVQMDGAGHHPPRKLMNDLRRAVTGHKRITIKYRSPNSGRSSKREIDPYGLMIRRGLWYLYGFCRLRREERMFRVDRIELLEKLRPGDKADFALPEDFSISRVMRHRAPWEFGGDPVREVIIRFHEDTFWLAQNAWGDLDSVEFDDKLLVMSARSVNDAAIVLWALEFADRAEILSPPALRKKMEDSLEGIIANAETGG